MDLAILEVESRDASKYKSLLEDKDKSETLFFFLKSKSETLPEGQ